MARRCGAKHICKSKCAKHHGVVAIFEILMFKNGTPLWHQAHLLVQMRQTSAGDQFWKFRSGKIARRCGKKYICKHTLALFEDQMSKNLKSRVEMSSQQKEDQHTSRVTRKKEHVREMLGTSRIPLFFSMIRGS